MAIEGFTAPVLLDYHRQDLFHPLVGGEPPLATLTLAPPANDGALVRQARVDDFVFQLRTKRALHRRGILAGWGHLNGDTITSHSGAPDRKSAPTRDMGQGVPVK